MAETSLITTGTNTALSKPSIGLPQYGAITEQRVVKEMQALFKGFSFDKDLKITEMFKTIDQIEVFAKEATSEINSAYIQCEMDEIMKSGAIAVRRWYFGWIVNKVLSEANYGEGVAKRIAASAGISEQYLYQYKDVGDRFDITDVYTLGIYKASWDMIRQLATIKDEGIRKTIISLYVDRIPDITDKVAIANASAAVLAAIQQLKSDQKQADKLLDVSNPKLLEQVANFEKDAPEYVEAYKVLTALRADLRKLVKQQRRENVMRACGDYFLMSDIINAEQRQLEIKAVAGEILEMLKTLEELIPLYHREVDSVMQSDLIEPEE